MFDVLIRFAKRIISTYMQRAVEFLVPAFDYALMCRTAKYQVMQCKAILYKFKQGKQGKHLVIE